jgi:ubiquinone/menaquinone biosynthesis C-methylase UbiE
MDGNEWYKGWFNSPYYHKLYFDRDEEEAGAFIKKLVEHLNPPPGALMLDVACGKGRHAKMLASLGFRVTGLDISPASIDEALKFQTEYLEFHVHDMRLPFHGNYFDYAFNFFTSFGYFKTLR